MTFHKATQYPPFCQLPRSVQPNSSHHPASYYALFSKLAATTANTINHHPAISQPPPSHTVCTTVNVRTSPYLYQFSPDSGRKTNAVLEREAQ